MLLFFVIILHFVGIISCTDDRLHFTFYMYIGD